MRNGLKIVYGKPRHTQSQGSVKCANRDIEDMLMTWLQSNLTTHWGDDLRFIYAMKNSLPRGHQMLTIRSNVRSTYESWIENIKSS